MEKRILSILLSIIMIVTLLPATVFAISSHTHSIESGEITFDKEILTSQDMVDLFTNGGNGYISKEAETINFWFENALTVGEGKRVNLCLNGQAFNIAYTHIRIPEGTSLHICDCGTGESKHNFMDDGSVPGLWLWADNQSAHSVQSGIIASGGKYVPIDDCVSVEGGEFILSGGTFAANKPNNNIVHVKSGSFTMNGGAICGNAGTAVKVESGASFTMIGGSITENTTTGSGCAVYNEGNTYFGGTAIVKENFNGGQFCDVKNVGSGVISICDSVPPSNGMMVALIDNDNAVVKSAIEGQEKYFASDNLGKKAIYADNSIKLDSITSQYWYMDEYGVEQVVPTETAPVVLTNSSNSWGGYVYAAGSITIGTVVLSNDANLILSDNAELTIQNGIDCGAFTLTVYGQRMGIGKLIVSNNTVGDGAGIKGNVTFYGGDSRIIGHNIDYSDTWKSEDQRESLSGDGIIGNVTAGGNCKVNIKGGGGYTPGNGVTGIVTVCGGNTEITGGTGIDEKNTQKSGDGINGKLIVTDGKIEVYGGSAHVSVSDSNVDAANQGGHGVYGTVEINGGSTKITGGNGGEICDGPYYGNPSDAGRGVDGEWSEDIVIVSGGSITISGGMGGVSGTDEKDCATGGTGVRVDMVVYGGNAKVLGGTGGGSIYGNYKGGGAGGDGCGKLVASGGIVTVIGGQGGLGNGGICYGGNGAVGCGILTVSNNAVATIIGGKGGEYRGDQAGYAGKGGNGCLRLDVQDNAVATIIGGQGGDLKNHREGCNAGDGGTGLYTDEITGEYSAKVSDNGIATISGGISGDVLAYGGPGSKGNAYFGENSSIIAKVETSSDASIYTDWNGTDALNGFFSLRLTNAHDHSFTYSASGDTITAECSNTAECPLASNEYKTTLTISAEGGTYDGTTTFPAITNNGTTGFTSVTGTTPVIEYYKGDAPVASAPVDAGTYTAKLTLTNASGQTIKNASDEDVVAATSYAIAKAVQTITADVNQSFVYLDTNKKVSASAIGTLSYAIKSGAATDVVQVDSSTGELTILKAGTTTVTAIAAETDNYNSASKDITISIGLSKTAEEPIIATGLVYTGSSQNGYTTLGTHAAITGTTAAINAGTYTFKATPETNYAWSDGASNEKSYNWTISKTDYTGTKTTSGSINANAGSSVVITLPDLPEGAVYASSASGFSYGSTSVEDGKLTLTVGGSDIPDSTAAFDLAVAVTGAKNYNDYDVTVTVTPVYHTHTFNYAADGSKITASCVNMETDCDLTDRKTTLTISATGGTYDGTTTFGAITDDAATGFTSVTGTTPVIEYYKGDDKQASAPVDAGTYTAKLTLTNASGQTIKNASDEDVVAATSYAIAKAVQTINADETQSFVYLDTNKKVSASAIGTLNYAIKDGAATDVVGVNASTGELTILKAGTTTITAIAAETDNYYSATKDITVSVGKKTVAKPTADSKTFTYSGFEQTYTPAGFDADTMAISGNKQTNANTTGYTVTVTLKDTANYEWSAAGDCTFNWVINKADQPAPTITGVTESAVTVDPADREKKLQYRVDPSTQWLDVPELSEDGSFELVGLTEGSHTVYLKALESANYKESSPASKTFTLDHYCVEYNANGGTGAPASVIKNKPDTVAVADLTGLKRNGYTAVSWNTKPDGSGDTHSTGSALSDGIILYAQWAANTYTVKFDANGGEGSMAQQNMTYDQKSALNHNSTLTRDGYTFAGWSTNKNGPVQFADGQDVTNLAANGEVVLYAIWAEETYQLRINVVSPTSSAVRIEIRRGNSVFTEASVSLDPSGTTYSAIKDISGLAGGVYNIVAKQSLSDKGITESAIQLVIVSTNASVDFNFTNGNVSAELDVKEGTPDVMVDGLNKEAESYYHHSADVKVKMTVEQQEECELPLNATPEQRETQKAIKSIKNVSASEVLSYMDITVEKTDIVDNVAQPSVRIDETSNVMEIAVPFNPAEKYNVRVYRHHDGSAEPFTRLNSRPSVFADGTYYVDEANCLIYIYAQKFSTYAIGYNTQPDAPADYGYGSGTSDEYPIKLNASLNGNVDLSANKSAKGRTIIISANANSGFGVGRVVVFTADGKPVTLKDLGNGKYSFVMPASAVTVNVMFAFVSSVADCPRDETCPIEPFGDTENDYWWHDGVHYCIENGLMIGVNEEEFKPLLDFSRAMLATILWRLSGSPETDFQYTFTDVKEGKWYTEAVRWAEKNKIFEGYSTGEFGPDDAITREQMMIVFCRYYQYRGNVANYDIDLSIFKDANTISDYAVDGVKWSVNNCVIQGDGECLNPKANCARAQAACIVQRFCEMFGFLNK